MISPEDVIQILNEICETDGNTHIVDPNTPILDGENNLDSMNLVQLCIVLEEKASSFDFDFDWTSEKAMSAMNSIFKTPKSIAEEFNRQLLNKKV